jgi:head-tail adaptor
MTAGKRTRLITFERGTVSADNYGGGDPTWATYASAWAEVLFGSGQERREASQEAGSQAATFICLWTPPLASVGVTDRIQFNGSAWDITNVALIGLNKEIHFTATRAHLMTSKADDPTPFAVKKADLKKFSKSQQRTYLERGFVEGLDPADLSEDSAPSQAKGQESVVKSERKTASSSK